MKTARFWHYHIGLVRLKIRAGETLHHSSGGRTDEGWTRESASYSFDGQTVTCQWSNDGADCDGRFSRAGVSHCPVDRLTAGYDDTENGAKFPDWQNGEYSQRDYAAESMGY